MKYLVATGDVRPAEGDRPSASKIYRNKVTIEGDQKPFKGTTLHETWQDSVRTYSSQPCFGHRPIDTATSKAGDYQWITYAEANEKVTAVASGLAGLGVSAGQKVGVYGANCLEWQLAMQACNRMSYACVPLYDTLGEDAVSFTINHSEAVAAFCQSSKLAPLATACKAVDRQRFKHVIYWGKADMQAVEALKSLDIPVHSFDEVTAAGQASPVDAVPPQPEDTCTIMYTSGTTGQPKGVLLTHKALVSSVATVIVYLRDSANITVGPGQYFLSFLPLAHIFDRLAEDCFIAMGGAVGFWQGNVKMLVDDIAALKPTVFIAVPRVLDRIYNGILDKINSTGGIAKYLFHWGYKRKLYYMQQGYSQAQASPLFDRVVFSKIKSRLGGRVRVICSGGAPLAADVEEFLRVTMCTAVVQGYGMTETCCAAGCITIPDNWEQFHTCGPVLPGAELRLESVPDMGYDATKEVEPAGEVLLRGPQLFSVYYKQEEKTAEALDDEGWFHTGDIAVLTKGDGIKVIDRKKNMFKLSQGEYVAAEKLELAYQHAPAAEQVWVYGDSFKSSLVAVVVPKKDAVLDWAKSAGKQGEPQRPACCQCCYKPVV
eukprot:GHUV01021783.1.p1 GENE.GHUV01021783.1~~GHUV01021783.1.p1  ORF type:complete len:600 (+),score=177.59 GHUV01021783.1:394-2193(+)